MSDAFICNAIRTPIGRLNGTLSTIRVDDLAAIPIKALVERNPGVDRAAVDDTLLGCANQAGEDNRNVARITMSAVGQLRRTGGRYPLALMCIGGVGQGIGLIVERL
jgi:acetyl-CoA C-acetyltransferase